MADDLKQRTVRGIAWLGVAQTYGQLTHLVVLSILTRLVADTDFGLIVMVAVFTAFMEIFQELGLTLAVIQKKEVSEEQLSTVFAVTVGLGVALSLLMALVVAPFVVRLYDRPRLLPIAALMGLPFAIASFSHVPSALLRKRLAFGRMVGVGMAAGTIGSAVGIWAAFQGFGVYALIIKSLATCTLRTVGICAVGGWMPTCRPRLRSALGLFRFGAFATAGSFVGWLHSWADKLLVAKYLGESLVAHYHLGFRIMLLPMRKVTQHVTQVAFSAFSAAQDDKARVRRGFAEMSKSLALIAFPMLIGLFAVAPEAVKVFLGPKWNRDLAALLIRIMVVPGCLISVGAAVWTIFRSQGRPDIQFRFDCFGTAVLIGAFVYGLRWGVVGVATSYALTQAVLTFPRCGLAFRLIDFRWRDYWEALKTPTIATLGMLAAVMGAKAGLQHAVDLSWIVLLIVAVTTGVASYAGMLWWIDRQVYDQGISVFTMLIHGPVRRILFAGPSRLLRRKGKLPEVGLESLVRGDVQLEPLVMDDIAMPPHSGFGDHDDITPLMKIVAARRPHIVVELGTAYGNTVANICRQCPEATVYTVNALSEDMTGFATTFDLTRDEIGRVYRTSGYADRVVQLYCNTLDLDLSEHLAEGSIDLAIVDACHDTAYVLNDFAKVAPFVRPGGIVLFHDTHPSGTGHAWSSYRACMLLRLRGYDVRHLADTWWGVWEKPDGDGKSLKALTELALWANAHGLT